MSISNRIIMLNYGEIINYIRARVIKDDTGSVNT